MIAFGDRIRESSSNAAGTSGDFDFDGAPHGYRPFSDVANLTIKYFTHNFDDEENPTTGDWEHGEGTVASNGLSMSRDTIHSSSAGLSTAVNWTAVDRVIVCIHPPTDDWLDADDNLSSLASASASRDNLNLGTACLEDEGSGNGLDADLLDALQGSSILKLAGGSQTISGNKTWQSGGTWSGSNTITGEANFNFGSTGRIRIPVDSPTGTPTKLQGSFWVEGTNLRYVSSSGSEWSFTGTLIGSPAGSPPRGEIWYDTADNNIYYIDDSLAKRRVERSSTVIHGDAGEPEGKIKVSGDFLRAYFGSGNERELHVDAAHGDHGDTSHTDVSHVDSHNDGSGSHTDSSHSDSHNDTHSDAPKNKSHTDTHSDTPHDDVGHFDSHGDHIDGSHFDNHFDSPHTDTAHTDTHTDTHTDIAHSDSHVDSHSDNAHGDSVGHSDSHNDTAHSDTHTDVHDDSGHGDQPVEIGP